VATLDRNQWPASVGNTGRFASESAFQARVSASLAVFLAPNGCPMLLVIVVAGDKIAAIAVCLEPQSLS
jgi:hypothetical protein